MGKRNPSHNSLLNHTPLLQHSAFRLPSLPSSATATGPPATSSSAILTAPSATARTCSSTRPTTSSPSSVAPRPTRRASGTSLLSRYDSQYPHFPLIPPLLSHALSLLTSAFFILAPLSGRATSDCLRSGGCGQSQLRPGQRNAAPPQQSHRATQGQLKSTTFVERSSSDLLNRNNEFHCCIQIFLPTISFHEDLQLGQQDKFCRKLPIFHQSAPLRAKPRAGWPRRPRDARTPSQYWLLP